MEHDNLANLTFSGRFAKLAFSKLETGYMRHHNVHFQDRRFLCATHFFRAKLIFVAYSDSLSLWKLIFLLEVDRAKKLRRKEICLHFVWHFLPGRIQRLGWNFQLEILSNWFTQIPSHNLFIQPGARPIVSLKLAWTFSVSAATASKVFLPT